MKPLRCPLSQRVDIAGSHRVIVGPSPGLPLPSPTAQFIVPPGTVDPQGSGLLLGSHHPSKALSHEGFVLGEELLSISLSGVWGLE